MWCLQRRGFALDITNIVSWQVHERWVDTLFRAYSMESASSTRPVTLSQLIKADCELWNLLPREFQSVRPNVHGEKPLDAAINRLQSDPRIVVHLMQLPSSRPSPSDVTLADPANPDPKRRRGLVSAQGALQTFLMNFETCISRQLKANPFAGRTAYNLKGCKSNAGGNPPACGRGAHVCAYCRKPGHGLQSCRNRKADDKR